MTSPRAWPARSSGSEQVVAQATDAVGQGTLARPQWRRACRRRLHGRAYGGRWAGTARPSLLAVHRPALHHRRVANTIGVADRAAVTHPAIVADRNVRRGRITVSEPTDLNRYGDALRDLAGMAPEAGRQLAVADNRQGESVPCGPDVRHRPV